MHALKTQILLAIMPCVFGGSYTFSIFVDIYVIEPTTSYYLFNLSYTLYTLQIYFYYEYFIQCQSNDCMFLEWCAFSQRRAYYYGYLLSFECLLLDGYAIYENSRTIVLNELIFYISIVILNLYQVENRKIISCV